MKAGGPPSLAAVHPDDFAALMQIVLRKSGSGYIYRSKDGSRLGWDNVPVPFQWLLSKDIDDSGTSDLDRHRLTSAMADVLASGQAESVDIDIHAPSGMQSYRVDLNRLDMGPNPGVLSIISDVSEARKRERVLRTLLRELSHRSKNLLAIIQGIATQTARQALSLDSFLTKFRGRIHSLASSQDLVTDSSWRGAYFFELAEHQFTAYASVQDAPFKAKGVNAHLSPNAALHIGLALHELIVNSASHGALSCGVNALTLTCSETIFDGQKAIEISWIEHIPPSTEPDDLGDHTFARTVLERVVPVAIGGKARYTTNPGQIEYHLTVPSREYEIITRIAE